MNSMLVPGAWWPVSRHTAARSPKRKAVDQRGAPVGDVGGVEGRLEELVLEDEPLVLAESRVDLRKGVGEAVLAVAQVALAGVVRAVGEPDLQVAAAGDVHDVDALEVVGDRLGPDALVDVGQAAELVVVVLEGVGVDRAETHSEVLCDAAELVVVVHLVPRDVQSHRGGETGQLVHLRRIRQLLLDRARRAGRGEDLEAGARVAERPGRQLNRLLGEPARDVGEGVHADRPFRVQVKRFS